MIIAIMAFVFVVLTSGTIEEESAIIGTLLASGYRRRELVAHYLALPAAVGIAAAVMGNVAGYTLMSEPMRNLYYGSYSLPPYYATWSWGVFAQTTVLPVATLVVITLLGLLRKMGHTPLEFLRHETSKGGVKRGFALPERLSFTTRFRLRGYSCATWATSPRCSWESGSPACCLLFSLAILPTMTHYAENLHNNVIAEHMYTLKAPLELDGTQSDREAWVDHRRAAKRGRRQADRRGGCGSCTRGCGRCAAKRRRQASGCRNGACHRAFRTMPCIPRKMRKMTLPARRTRLTQRRIRSTGKSIR